MARLAAPPSPAPLKRLALAVTRLMFGKVLEPSTLWAHHTGVFWTSMVHEGTLQRVRYHLPAELRDLVVHRVSIVIGCPWCIDFGAMAALRAGLTPERLLAVDDHVASPLFTDREKACLAFADAATATPPTVTDAQVESLRADLGDAGLVELVYLVALENHRSRFNHSLGITSQGFTDAAVCALPQR